MRKVMRKVKSQWVVLGVMGATVVALGTANVPGVSAEEVDGQAVSGTSDTNAGNALTVDLANIQEATIVEVINQESVINPYNFSDWYESMGVDSYVNGMWFNMEGINSTFQVYVKTANDTGDLYLTITQMGATEAEDVVLIENQIIKSNTNYSFVEEQDIEPVYFSFRNINADNYVEPNYNRFEEVTDESVDPSNIKIYRTEPFENAHKSEGLHFYESEGHLVGEAVIFVDMLGSYAPSAGGEVKYETVYKFVDINNETEYFKVVKDTSTTDSNFSQIISETVVDYPATVSVKDNAINTQPWNVEGWQNIGNSSDILNKTVDVTKEQVTDYGVTWALVSLNGKELGWISKGALTTQNYAQIVSEIAVDYPATISRGTDAINTAPWGARGFQTITSSAAYVGKTVDVIKEQTTDYGVTWAQISLNGEVLGWIAKDALAVQTYAAVVSETVVDYPATVNRDSDAINTAPWGVKGYQTLSSSAAFVGQTVEVTKEQVTDYGVTWALVSQNGKELGWIAKDALKIQTYAQITKETDVDYSATISRDSDAINTAPWGVKGYQTLSSSAAYVGQTVEVTKEQVTDYGVTWALVSQNGKELGWIAKDALKVQTYAQITKEAAVSYDAIVNRDSDAINTAPWGVKGYQTLSSSAAYAGQIVEVTKEQTTDYGVTWALVSQNGKELGWIAKDALKVQTYAQITKETAVSYDAIVNRDSDAINTAPWGVKGYQTLYSSAAYAGQTVEVTKEQVTDYGVTWALVSQNGKELGWIAKDALKVQTYAKIISEQAVNYDAKIARNGDGINTQPWNVKGWATISNSSEYLGEEVTAIKEVITDYGVTWVLISSGNQEMGWIAKDALSVIERVAPVITLIGEQTITIEFGTAYEDAGIIVTDNIDDNPVVTMKSTVDTSVLGSYSVDYTAKDASGNETVATRVVIVKDSKAPLMNYVGEKNLTLANSSEFSLPKVTGTDNADAEINVTSIITDEDGNELTTIDTSKEGSYTITYTASDASGNLAEDLIITIMVNPADLSAYNEALKAVAEADYTETKWARYQEIVNGNIVTSENTQVEVDAATAIIKDAQKDLVVHVEAITVTAENDAVGVLVLDSLQMHANFSPIDAKDATIHWSVENGTGSATIDDTGLLTALSNGTVNVIATVDEGSAIIGKKEVKIATGVAIRLYSGTDTDIVIPDLIEVNQMEFDYSGWGYFENFAILGASINDYYVMPTYIYPYVFRFNELTSVIIPESVTSIGEEAFHANELTDLKIPDNVTFIGVSAFAYNNLTSVVIPEGVTSIPNEAFNVNNLTNVVIPEKVTSIGEYAFNSNELANVEIPVNVTSIGRNAFYNNQLTNIVIPNSVKTLGKNAFGENKLTRITIGEGVEIGDDLLSDIFNHQNYFRNAYEVGGEGTYIGTQDGVWIKEDVALSTDIMISSNSDVMAIGQTMQMSAIVVNKPNTTGVTWSLLAENGAAVMDNNGLVTAVKTGIIYVIATADDGSRMVGVKKIELAKPVSIMGYNGSALDIVIPEIIDGSLMKNGIYGDFKILGTLQSDEKGIVTSISSLGDKKLTSVVLPDSLTNIESYAFQNNMLTSVVIPDGVTSIGNNAFSQNQLLSVYIPDSVTTIGATAFYANQLTNVVIPDNVVNIGSSAFGNNKLTSIVIPDSMLVIGVDAFSNNQLTNVTIPGNITKIENSAFKNNLLTNVIISEGVKAIGYSAFYGNKLIDLVIPNSVTSIENFSFYDNHLSSVMFLNSATSIGSYAFGLNELTSLELGENVTSIGNNAFSGNFLTEVSIPGSVTTIGNNAFDYNKLTSVNISEGVTSIGSQAFNGNQLTSVIIPEGVISIGNSSFSNNQLSIVEISNTVSSIGASAFYNNQLAEIVIPDSVTTIGSSAFGNNHLTNIVIPEGVTFIGNGALSQNQLTSITIGEGVQIGDNLLTYNNYFRSAYLSGGAGIYTGTQGDVWTKYTDNSSTM